MEGIDKKTLKVIQGVMQGKKLSEGAADLAQLIVGLMEAFFNIVPTETAWKFNAELSKTLELYTCSEIKKNEHMLRDRKKRLDLLKTVGYENLARKYDYSNDIKQFGYQGQVTVVEVFRDSYKELIGQRVKRIGRYALNPDTAQIEADPYFGAWVYEHEGKIILDNEVGVRGVIGAVKE